MENQYTLKQLSDMLKVEYHGDPNAVVSSIAPIQSATEGQVCFLDNPRYRKFLKETAATIVILRPSELEICPANALVTDNPYLAYAKVAELFETKPKQKQGIHPSAVIGEGCHIHPSVSIGPLSVIGDGCELAENVVIGSNCVLESGVTLGEGTALEHNVTIHYNVKIGKSSLIHSGVVIGADGFGNANDKGKWYKVPQIGTVRIGDDVEIGSNTTIDRGALEDTEIDDGVRLDNLCQIAHNVKIGANTAIAGCTGIAGSVTIGKHCTIGGGVGFNGHVTITDNVFITGMSGVHKNIREPGLYGAGTPLMNEQDGRKTVFYYRQLPNLADRIKKLEKSISQQAETDN